MKLLLFVLLPALIFSKSYKKEFSHEFKVSPGAILILENGDGDAAINVWDKDQIKVEVKYNIETRSSRNDDIRDFDVDFRQSGERCYVIGRETNRMHIGFISINYIEYTYKISLPAYVKLDILSDDGHINIFDVTNEVICKSEDGEINIENVKGKLIDLRSDDGDIRVKSAEGEFLARTSDGDIIIDGLIASESEIHTSDGRIRISESESDFFITADDGDVTMRNVAGKVLDVKASDADVEISYSGKDLKDMYVSTSDGRVRIELENPVSVDFSLETDDGHIRFDLDEARIIRETRRTVRGELGNGDGKIVVRTNDGSISLQDVF